MKTKEELVKTIMGEELWKQGTWYNVFWRSHHKNAIVIMLDIHERLSVGWENYNADVFDAAGKFELGDPDLVEVIRKEVSRRLEVADNEPIEIKKVE